MKPAIRTLTVAASLLAAAVAATAAPANAAETPGTSLRHVKSYLLEHTAKLSGFTNEFRAVAREPLLRCGQAQRLRVRVARPGCVRPA